jgi:hypothetical protein
MALVARWMRIAPVGEEEGRRAIYAALAAMQDAAAPPILVWVQGGARHHFALIAPLRLLPRPERRISWALSPALATCRYFGVPAYLRGTEVWAGGRLFAESAAEAIGECVVTSSSMLIPFPVESHVEDVFRQRIEAQHDWGFETAWPIQAEANAMAEARSEFAW